MNGDDVPDRLGSNPSANQSSDVDSSPWPSKVAAMLQSALPKARLNDSQRRRVLLFLQLLFTLWILSGVHLFCLAQQQQKRQQQLASSKTINFKNESHSVGEIKSPVNTTNTTDSGGISSLENNSSFVGELKSETTTTAEKGLLEEVVVATEYKQEIINVPDSSVSDFVANNTLNETVGENETNGVNETSKDDPVAIHHNISDDIKETATVSSAEVTIDANVLVSGYAYVNDTFENIFNETASSHGDQKRRDEIKPSLKSDVPDSIGPGEAISLEDVSEPGAVYQNIHQEPFNSTLDVIAKAEQIPDSTENLSSPPSIVNASSAVFDHIGNVSSITEPVESEQQRDAVSSGTTTSLVTKTVNGANVANDQISSNNQTNLTDTLFFIENDARNEILSDNLINAKEDKAMLNSTTLILDPMQSTDAISKEETIPISPLDSLKVSASEANAVEKGTTWNNTHTSLIAETSAPMTKEINASIVDSLNASHVNVPSENGSPVENGENEQVAYNNDRAELNFTTAEDAVVNRTVQSLVSDPGEEAENVITLPLDVESKEQATVTLETKAVAYPDKSPDRIDPPKPAQGTLNRNDSYSDRLTPKNTDGEVTSQVVNRPTKGELIDLFVNSTSTSVQRNYTAQANGDTEEAEAVQDKVEGKSAGGKPAPKGSLADFFNKVNTNNQPAGKVEKLGESKIVVDPKVEAKPTEANPAPKKGSLAEFFNKVNTNSPTTPSAPKTHSRQEFSQRQDREAAYQKVTETMPPPEPDKVAVPLQQGKSFSGVWGRGLQSQDKKLIVNESTRPSVQSQLMSDASAHGLTGNDDSDAPSKDDTYKAQTIVKPSKTLQSGKKGKAKSVNAEFVEGLDDINKLFEGVDPPDELDVGAVGSSIQEVLMGKGAQIVTKRVVQGLREVRKVLVEARKKVASRFKREEGALVTREEVVQGAQDVWKTCQHAFQGFRGLLKELVGEIWPADELEDEDILEMALGSEKGDDGLYQFSQKAIQESRKLQNQAKGGAESRAGQDKTPSGTDKKLSREESIEQLIQQIRQRNVQ